MCHLSIPLYLFIPLNDKIIEVIGDWCSILITVISWLWNSSWSAFSIFPRGVHDFSLSLIQKLLTYGSHQSLNTVYFCNCTDHDKEGAECQITCQTTHRFIQTFASNFSRVKFFIVIFKSIVYLSTLSFFLFPSQKLLNQSLMASSLLGPKSDWWAQHVW